MRGIVVSLEEVSLYHLKKYLCIIWRSIFVSQMKPTFPDSPRLTDPERRSSVGRQVCDGVDKVGVVDVVARLGKISAHALAAGKGLGVRVTNFLNTVKNS